MGCAGCHLPRLPAVQTTPQVGPCLKSTTTLVPAPLCWDDASLPILPLARSKGKEERTRYSILSQVPDCVIPNSISRGRHLSLRPARPRRQTCGRHALTPYPAHRTRTSAQDLGSPNDPVTTLEAVVLFSASNCCIRQTSVARPVQTRSVFASTEVQPFRRDRDEPTQRRYRLPERNARARSHRP